MTDRDNNQDLPPNWSKPINYNGINGGLVWIGREEATAEDIDAIGGSSNADPESLCGLYGADWSNYYDTMAGTSPDHKMGGMGSTVYECQRVGDGVKFAKKPIFYVDESGKMVNGIPPNCGAYHYDHALEANREGPAPGSVAQTLLGTGEYGFNANRGWYVIRDDDPEA